MNAYGASSRDTCCTTFRTAARRLSSSKPSPAEFTRPDETPETALEVRLKPRAPQAPPPAAPSPRPPRRPPRRPPPAPRPAARGVVLHASLPARWPRVAGALLAFPGARVAARPRGRRGRPRRAARRRAPPARSACGLRPPPGRGRAPPGHHRRAAARRRGPRRRPALRAPAACPRSSPAVAGRGAARRSRVGPAPARRCRPASVPAARRGQPAARGPLPAPHGAVPPHGAARGPFAVAAAASPGGRSRARCARRRAAPLLRAVLLPRRKPPPPGPGAAAGRPGPSTLVPSFPCSRARLLPARRTVPPRPAGLVAVAFGPPVPRVAALGCRGRPHSPLPTCRRAAAVESAGRAPLGSPSAPATALALAALRRALSCRARPVASPRPAPPRSRRAEFRRSPFLAPPGPRRPPAAALPCANRRPALALMVVDGRRPQCCRPARVAPLPPGGRRDRSSCLPPVAPPPPQLPAAGFAPALLPPAVFVASLRARACSPSTVLAIKKTGLDKLLEAIILQSEILELKANPDRTAEGVVIEAKLDRGRGSVATVLVQAGTLKPGDILVAGDQWGRVRALVDDRGDQVKDAGPAMPVEVLGLHGTPLAGDRFAVVENESKAREISEYRQRLAREKSVARQAGQRGSLEQMMTQLQSSGLKEFPLIIKGDVQGSIEAIVAALDKLGTEEVRARIVHSGAGAITESDVSLAETSGAAIIGFNVRANKQARDAASQSGSENP